MNIMRAVKRAADDDGLREATMTKMEKSIAFSRRSVLKAGGALVVSVGMPIGMEPLLASTPLTRKAPSRR